MSLVIDDFTRARECAQVSKLAKRIESQDGLITTQELVATYSHAVACPICTCMSSILLAGHALVCNPHDFPVGLTGGRYFRRHSKRQW